MTALTTSTCVDLIGTEKMEEERAIRGRVHVGVALVLLVVIMIFKSINDESCCCTFTAANYIRTSSGIIFLRYHKTPQR